MKIALFGKTFEPDREPYLRQLVQSLQRSGVSLAVYKPFYEQLQAHLPFEGEVSLFEKHEELIGLADLVFSIGGDGTLLDTVPLLRNSGIPVLGINMGRLGFLSSISKNEIDMAVKQVTAKRFSLEHRTLISLSEPKDLFPVVNYALNEVTVFRKETTSLIVIQVFVDGLFVNSYWADGLILATPTGSTAYSLSAGGPIITPQSANFVITPIATHNLSVRPIVIPDTSVIKLKVVGRHTTYSLSMDSRSVVIDKPIELEFRKADFGLNMVMMEEKDFFKTIRNKLLWGLDIRN